MTSYIEKNLLPDEQIVYRTKKHYIIFLIPMLWTIATVICLINFNPFVVKLAIAPALAALVTWGNTLLIYATSDFAITNKRVMMREGFFFRHTNETRLATISNVTANQSLLAQLLSYGTIIISPFGGENDVFTEIANPFEFQKHAQIQLDKISSPMGRA